MSINPDSILHRIQNINEQIDSFRGPLNEEGARIISAALDNLVQRGEHISPIEKVALSSLASRVSALSKPTVSEEKIANVVRHLLKKEVKGSPRFDFSLCEGQAIERILSRSSKDREEILLAAEPFIKEYMHIDDVASILRSIAAIPASERASVLSSAQRFITEGMNADDVCSILDEIIEIPASERASILSSAQLFIKKRMNVYDVYSILRSIAAIPASERASVLSAAQPLMTERMSLTEISNVLTATAKIPAPERASVCIASQLFIKEKLRGSELIRILDAIAKIPASERASVLSSAQPFIKEYMHIDDVASILSGIDKIPNSDRGIVCKEALFFIKEGMGGSALVTLLNAIANIPSSERASVLSSAQPLIKEGMDEHDVDFILRALTEIPLKNRPRIFKCLEKIENYANKNIANSLMGILFQNRTSLEYGLAQAELVSARGKKKKSAPEIVVYKLLPSIVPSKWIAEAKELGSLNGEQERAITNLLSFLNSSKADFHKTVPPLAQTYLLAALALDEAKKIPSIRKVQILSYICNQRENIKGLNLIIALCKRKETESLKTLPLESSIEGFMLAFKESLQRDRFINLSDIEKFEEKYLGAFENTRIPFAIESYLSGLRGLNDVDLQNAAGRFIRSILEGTFKEERYRVDNNRHLAQIQTQATNIFEKWKSFVFEAPVISAIEEPSKDKAFSFELFFKEKLSEAFKHSYRDGVDLLPHLSAFVKAPQERHEEILAALTQNILQDVGLLESEINPEKKEEVNNRLQLEQMQKICMELILSEAALSEEQMQRLESMLPIIAGLELENDFNALVSSFRLPQTISSLEKVQFCAGWEDLFLSGTEIAGSCQRIDGDPNLNKCLLAYCLDGKNGMIAVKGPDGRLLARSMLRLLWDQTDSKPVLFLDRLYPTPCPKERESAIKMAAKECSRQLGLELFEISNERASTEKIIASLGSSCPYEYADGAEGVMPNGIFSVRNPRKIEL